MSWQTNLLSSELSSPLATQKQVRPEGGRVKRVLVTTLILTSLVDAFSILVIYLLVSTTSGGKEEELHKLQLPTATQAKIFEPAVTLRFAEEGLLVNEEVVDPRTLLDTFKTHLTSWIERNDPEENAPLPLLIQADKRIEFQSLSPILTMASEAGFTQYKFAVIQEAR